MKTLITAIAITLIATITTSTLALNEKEMERGAIKKAQVKLKGTLEDGYYAVIGKIVIKKKEVALGKWKSGKGIRKLGGCKEKGELKWQNYEIVLVVDAGVDLDEALTLYPCGSIRTSKHRSPLDVYSTSIEAGLKYDAEKKSAIKEKKEANAQRNAELAEIKKLNDIAYAEERAKKKVEQELRAKKRKDRIIALKKKIADRKAKKAKKAKKEAK